MNTQMPSWNPFAEVTKFMQNIAPQTTWFPTTYEVNFAGNRAVESDVVANVASYGRQLGALTDAVLELAGKHDTPAVKRLRKIAADIEERKEWHKTSLEDDLRKKLDELKKLDPAMLTHLMSRYAQ